MSHLAPLGPVYQAGTLSGNPVATAAGLATLKGCTDDLYPRLEATARTIADAASAALAAEGVPHTVQWAGSMFSVFFRDAPVDELRRGTRPGHRGIRALLPLHARARASTCRRARSSRGSSAARTTTRRSARSSRRCPPRPGPPPTPVTGRSGSFATIGAMTPAPTADRTVVHLVRHGEVHNPDRVLYGRLPEFHLSALGREMAELVAAHLADHDVTHVVSSPLERARETAAPDRGGPRPRGRARRRGRSRPRTPSRGAPSPVARASSATRRCGSSWSTRCARRGASPTSTSRRACRPPSTTRASWPAATRPSSCRTRRRSGCCASPSRAAASSTTRASRECTLASLTSLTYRGDELESLAYSEPAAALLPQAQAVPAHDPQTSRYAVSRAVACSRRLRASRSLALGGVLVGPELHRGAGQAGRPEGLHRRQRRASSRSRSASGSKPITLEGDDPRRAAVVERVRARASRSSSSTCGPRGARRASRRSPTSRRSGPTSRPPTSRCSSWASTSVRAPSAARRSPQEPEDDLPQPHRRGGHAHPRLRPPGPDDARRPPSSSTARAGSPPGPTASSPPTTLQGLIDDVLASELLTPDDRHDRLRSAARSPSSWRRSPGLCRSPRRACCRSCRGSSATSPG